MEFEEAEAALRDAVRQIRRVRHAEWDSAVDEALEAAEKTTLNALAELDFAHAPEPSPGYDDPDAGVPRRVLQERERVVREAIVQRDREARASDERSRKRAKKEQRVGRKKRR
jgi:hypothetical protein